MGERTPEYYNDLADASEEGETDAEGIIVDVESAKEAEDTGAEGTDVE